MLVNAIDQQGGNNRQLRTIRGVGTVPEGMITGTIFGPSGAESISGTGGLILNNVSPQNDTAGGPQWANYANTATAAQIAVINVADGTGATGTGSSGLQWALGTNFYSGGLFVGSSDAASTATVSPLGNNATTLQIGNNTVTGDALVLGNVNTGLMTFGVNKGKSGGPGLPATPDITIARNLIVGAGGTGIMTVGGFTADHTAFTGTISLGAPICQRSPPPAAVRSISPASSAERRPADCR